MPYIFANKLDELLSEPSVVENRIDYYTLEGLSDKACELLDEISSLGHELFVKEGVISRQKRSVLMSRGYDVKQGMSSDKYRVAVSTPKGELYF